MNIRHLGLQVTLLGALASSALVMSTPAPIASAATEKECFTASNPVSCENSKPGTPRSEWTVERVGDPTIQGYATSMSVNVGQTESFKIDTPASSYHINILRLGYYGGDGARTIASNIKPTATLPQTQPACLTNSTTGLIDCGNWGVSASWTVPSNAISGVYIALLVRNDTGGESQIPFVVRNDASKSEVLLQTSDASWEAYNAYGGNSLYTCTVSCPPGDPEGYKAAYAVSYNRPFDGSFTTDNGYSYLYYAEYQMMYWLEEQGYNVSYTSESEVASNGSLLKNHKVFISSGHDEYWSDSQRASVEAALAAGVNLAFFSGNEVFWKTRWAPSTEGSNTANRTLITYKETHFNSPVDPEDPPTWTGSWRDPRFSPPADGGKPENSLTGQFFLINSGSSEITVPYQYSKLRLWRNTAVAKLTSGKELTLAPGTDTLGYEWDEDLDNGFRPTGEFDASSTTVSGTEAFRDYGSNVTTGTTATHHLTLYKAPSGALVFGAGTVQWSWGLADINAWEAPSTEPSEGDPDPNMEQATVNLLADMGAQPGTLSSGLVAATKSTDTTTPTSAITSPTAGSTVTDGSAVTITGTAAETGAGVVAGVEVSTDGGSTWHPATLTSAASTSVTWSYSWVANGNPTTTIESRAVDDSGNLQTSASISGTAKTVNVSCSCSLWGSTTPATADSGDPLSTEVGVKFTSSAYGSVTGIRFYKAATNTGTHIGTLWTSTGTLLAQATFTSETASGWQQVNFATPVTISPNTTYVAAYLAPSGHYSATEGYFFSPPPTGGHVLSSPPLQATPASDTSINGLYSYSATSTFPSSTYQGTNYWVDVAFTPAAAPGTVTGVTATASSASANVSWTAPSTGGQATTYTVTAYSGTTAEGSVAVTGAPPATSMNFPGLTAGTSYTFKVQASNPNGSGAVSAASNAVTPTPAAAPPAPTGVSALPATHQALVSWTAPSANGGSAITGYTITPYIGATAQTTVTASASSTSATVTGLTNGSAYTFTVTATNAIGKGTPSAASAAVTPGDTLFDFATPAIVDSGEATPIELGVKFTSSAYGYVAGIRFYKAATNTGTHLGSLWTAAGALLAEATFTTETASGWQDVYFSKPVEITPGAIYVAGYLAPAGHYSVTAGAFTSAPINNGPLQALATVNSPDGLFSYSSTSVFPTSTFNGNNYFVDVLFDETGGPAQVTGVTATAGPGSANVSWSAPSSASPITSYAITPYIGTTAQAATTITGAPPATTATVSGLKVGTSYTFTVQALSGSIAGAPSAASGSVTPTALTAPSAPVSVTAQPATGEAQVSWAAPSSNGGVPITGYTVSSYRNGLAAGAPVSVSATTTTTTVKYLENGYPYTFKVQATNAIGTGPESAASAAVTPQNTIFDLATPATVDSGDANSTEVGVRFTSSAYGEVTGIRFYKAPANTGTHIGTLWTASGQLLAEATFTTETASGWQEVRFPTPVAIKEGATYVAAYFAPNGHYSDTPGGFTTAVSNPPLQALASGATPNGLYTYSATNTFPSSGINANNYYVDVTFIETLPPGIPKNVTATASYESAVVSWSAPSNGGPVGKYKIVPYIGSTAQAATTITGTPPATTATIAGLKPGTAYTFTVQALNSIGTVGRSTASSPVTPLALSAPSEPQGVSATPATGQAQVSWAAPATNGGVPISGYTVTPYIGAIAQNPVSVPATTTSTTITGLSNGTSYTFTVAATNAIGKGTASQASPGVMPDDTILDFAAPSTIDSGATEATEVGVAFTSSVYGSVTGIRFYKAAGNTGTHTGSLWTSAGTLLATVTFTSETASGWQEASFSEPVELVPGLTYVAAYVAPNGRYSVTPNGFASAITNGPLQALATGATPNGNGVFSLGLGTAFPKTTFNGNNYFVDVLFAEAPPPGQVTNVSATAGNESASVSWSAPSTGSPVTTYTVTPYVGATALPATTVTGSPPQTSTTVSGLKIGSEYTFKVTASGVNGTGAPSAPSNGATPLGQSVPSAPLNVSATPATGQALVSWSAPSSNGNSAITGYTVTPYVGAVAQPTVQAGPSATSAIVGGLTDGTSYTFKVEATNAIGPSVESAASREVMPLQTIFDFATPATVDSGEGAPIELGVKFASEVNGYITGIRFYKSAANTGTHVGSLWSTSGEVLATATFTSETASGWQEVNFSPAYQVSAGTVYVAGYSAPNGHYSVTPNGFAKAVSNGPVQALATGTSADGVFGQPGEFPTSTFNGNNYFVDVMFDESAPPGRVAKVTATAGIESATVSWSAPTGSGEITGYEVIPYVGAVAQTPIAVTGTPPATSTTVNGLKPGTEYTFKVQALTSTQTLEASTASNGVTPTALAAPAAPTNVSATVATRQALVSWSAPSNNGGSAITGYTVTPYLGASAQPSVTVGPAETSAKIPGLSNGTAYTFTVAASNAVGEGKPSAASAPATPEDTILDLATPETAASAETTGTEVGVKFTASVYGSVTGIRFYKGAGNTGTHIGSLWTAAGTLLAEATFTSETASGWQQVNFSKAVEIIPGTTYVAGYFAPNGHYSVTSGEFATSLTNGPLQALATGMSADGVSSVGLTSIFPTTPSAGNNYFVDVLFAEASPPGQVPTVSASAGVESATVSWTAPSSGGPVATYTVTPYVGSTPQASTSVTGTPPATTATIGGLKAGVEYSFRVQASSVNGSGAESAASSPVTPTTPEGPSAPTSVSAVPATGQALVSWTPPSNTGGSAITGYTVTPYIGAAAQTPVATGSAATSATITGLANGTAYTFTVTASNLIGKGPASAPSAAVTPEDTIFNFATPATLDSGESNSTEVGIKFTSSVYGSVTGIRFYKAATNTGTHVGSLWSASGALLAQATFTSETGSGWQEVNFPAPVEVTPGTTYVAAYLAPSGHYSSTSAAFATSGITSGPLQALANTTSPDGVYSLTSTSAFPTSSLNASNYYVDVMFAEAPPPGQVGGVSATAGLESATVSWSAPTSGGPVATYTVTPYLGSLAQAATTVTGAPPVTSTTVSGLKAGSAYTFTVQASSANGAGAPSAPYGPITPSALTETAQPGDGQVALSWTGPQGSAGSPYTVVASPGGGTCTSTSVTSCTVTGLTDGQTYTFALTGDGGRSASVSATPYPASVMTSSAGLSLWLDGADSSSEYTSTACTGQTAGTGQAIGCWADKSGLGENFSQASSAAQPSLGTLGGHGAISFTGSGQTEALNSINATDTYQTVFIAAQTSTTSSGLDQLFGQTNAAFGIRQDVSATPGPLASPSASDWATATGTPAAEWTNGLQAFEASLATPTVIVDQSATPETIAATVGDYDLSLGLLGQVGEVIAFKGTLTAAQRETVQGYLARKWGATILAASAPAITKQPAAATVTEGATATFSAAASGVPTPAVQWQVYANADSGWTNIGGATATTYTTAATTTTESGYQYRAVFTNSVGTATTSAAVLTVGAAAGAPKVTTQPSPLTVAEGGAILFSAAASGTPTPTVQWQISFNNGSTWAELTGATSASENFGAAVAAQNGALFRAVFTNSAGTATTNAALLTVTAATAAPKVTTQPVSVSVSSGSTATFTAAASGSPTPTVQWQLSENSGSTWTNISGATSTTYVSGVASSIDNGYQYRAVFTNSAGSATSSAAVLTVTTPLAAPKITTQPASVNVGVFGGTATFTAAASGNPTPTVQWQQSTNSGKTWTNISGATSTSYKVTGSPFTNNGYEFRAVFTNSQGSATTNAAKLTA